MKDLKEWLKQLKPGDEVVYSYNRGFGSSENIRKVDKITPKGFIKVGDVLFYPDTGYSRGDYGCSIYKPTEAIKKRIYETAIIKKSSVFVRFVKKF